jgi:hypothetical protein
LRTILEGRKQIDGREDGGDRGRPSAEQAVTNGEVVTKERPWVWVDLINPGGEIGLNLRQLSIRGCAFLTLIVIASLASQYHAFS